MMKQINEVQFLKTNMTFFYKEHNAIDVENCKAEQIMMEGRFMRNEGEFRKCKCVEKWTACLRQSEGYVHER